MRERGQPHLHLFFARSGVCMSTERVEAWAPGGDVLLSASADAQRWSEPRVVGAPPVDSNPLFKFRIAT